MEMQNSVLGALIKQDFFIKKLCHYYLIKSQNLNFFFKILFIVSLTIVLIYN